MIKISCLGEFTVTDTESGKVLNEVALRSDMLKKLFIYMAMHRDHPVSVQELSEALWVEDETDNPQGALKNLMYRMRTALKKVFGDTNFFNTNLGSYSFNEELEVSLDLEEFEKLCKVAQKEKDTKKKLRAYENAMALYRGDFYEGKGDRTWIVTATTYYHSLFLSSVKALSSIYMEEGLYKEAEDVLSLALRFDNVDEALHCELIRSYIKQGNLELATKSFENAKKILKSALGIRESKNLNEVHSEILKMSKGSSEDSLQDIHADMVEDEEPDGAFICGYAAFKEIFRLEARKASRLGEAEHVLLLTVRNKYANSGKEETERFLINRAMKYLEDAVRHSLRIGDVAAKYSDNQFIVMLPACTYECTEMVAERIVASFADLFSTDSIEIETDIEEVNGVNSHLVV